MDAKIAAAKASAFAMSSLALSAVVAALAAPSASATVDLTAIGTRIGTHPAYVRVVVDFTDGLVADSEVEAIDQRAADGAVRIRLRHRSVQAQAAPASRAGVRAVVIGARDRLDVRATYARRRFKYVQVTTLHAPERLAIDLYRSRPPRSAARDPSRAPRLPRAYRSPPRRALVHGPRPRARPLRALVPGARARPQRTQRGPQDHDRRGGLERARRLPRQGTRARNAGRRRRVGQDGSLACIVQVGVVLAP